MGETQATAEICIVLCMVRNTISIMKLELKIIYEVPFITRNHEQKVTNNDRN